MTKKDLIAHCITLGKKLARKQITIEDLRKKKGVRMHDCADCKEKDRVYKDQLTEANADHLTAEEIRNGVIEEHEARNSQLAEDLIEVEKKIIELKHEAEIDRIKMESKVKELAKVEKEKEFYKNRLFPDHTPTQAATHAASISMMGGGGNLGQSPANHTASPDAP